jgi:hypothetical protein
MGLSQLIPVSESSSPLCSIKKATTDYEFKNWTWADYDSRNWTGLIHSGVRISNHVESANTTDSEMKNRTWLILGTSFFLVHFGRI